MKKGLLVLWLCCLSVLGVAQSPQRFFPKELLTQIGVYYYPEHWDESQWERDIKKIADLGFEYIHVGEFAWVFMEPQKGKYDFRWLDKVVDLAGKYKLKVIMCTPTSTPPVWLTQKHPEIFIRNSEGQTAFHGSRDNYSTSSDVYRKYTAQIVAELGKRYGQDARVMGWQLDNEPARSVDYSPVSEKKFKEWLKKKYVTISALNDAWGTKFWSMVYNDFNQVRLPNSRLQYGPSPHAVLDSRRFSADQLAAFLDFQAQTLRKYIGKEQWIMTNYTSLRDDPGYDPQRTNNLDFTCYTNYPVHGTGEMLGDKGFRVGSMATLAFMNDYYRTVRGVYGVMELQPGQVNWGSINPQPEPGAVHMWLWHTFMGGTTLNCTYRFRQPIYGSELYHYGIVNTDGVTPTRGGLEFSKYIREVKELRKQYKPNLAPPASYTNRRTALLMSIENFWDQNIQRQTSQWQPYDHVTKYFKAIKSLGAPVDFVTEQSDWSAYKVLIVPAYQLVDKELIAKIRQYADQGGQVVISCRTGHKDKNGHLWQAKWAEPISELIGGDVAFFDLMMPTTEGEVSFAGNSYKWNNWGDVLQPNPSTQVLATYTNQFYNGSAAVSQAKQGKGTVTYIGVDTNSGELEKAVLQKVYQGIGIQTTDYPAGINVEYRDGFWVAVNYSSKPYTLPLPVTSKILVGEKVLPSPGVTVWTE
ncbi:beta-galactosidase [Hymenobacter sp. GOD-10R]|uniref:beta-galactosidase n=1 Tax=Hymenobacter sp. GOD-10R TaxID=3093922 RepID=UPI002D79D71D|nr:beta-galactosidase [Hymenobacter sp. GOD-10R]WRQ30978.1 beta-galactosidase [Hymenobacter sp. GOD-10R]